MSELLDQLRAKIRLKHYSIRTEEAYVRWCKRFILFHHKRHPAEMGAPEVEQYLTHLAVNQNVAAAVLAQSDTCIIAPISVRAHAYPRRRRSG